MPPEDKPIPSKVNTQQQRKMHGCTPNREHLVGIMKDSGHVLALAMPFWGCGWGWSGGEKGRATL